MIAWRVVRGGERSVIEIEGFFGEFLKRWIKDFDRYFPTKEGLGSLRRWLQSFAWFHNLNHGWQFFNRALQLLLELTAPPHEIRHDAAPCPAAILLRRLEDCLLELPSHLIVKARY